MPGQGARVGRSLMGVLVSAAVFAASMIVAGQQATDTIDPAAVPVDQEQHHKVVFTNEHVRILDALFPPLAVSQFHSHLFDNVAITVRPGRDDAQGQMRVGFAAFARGGYSHTVTNPNTAPMRFIDVELLTPPVEPGETEALERHDITFRNARVRVYRVKVDAGQVLAGHRHAAGYVSVVVRGGEPGTWRWHDANEAASPLAAGKQALEVVEVEPR